jgi:hypothetical protein
MTRTPAPEPQTPFLASQDGGPDPSQALVRGRLFLGWSAPRRPLIRVKRDTRCATGGVGIWEWNAWLGVVGKWFVVRLGEKFFFSLGGGLE